MEGLRRNAEFSLQDSRLSGRELNPLPPVYILGMPDCSTIQKYLTVNGEGKKAGDGAVMLRVLKGL